MFLSLFGCGGLQIDPTLRNVRNPHTSHYNIHIGAVRINNSNRNEAEKNAERKYISIRT
jgi:hypothetical protein